MRKVISLLTALVMCSVSMITATAEDSSFTIGDVDMDGVVTGHDTAMVSRYVLDDSYSLTAEQLVLADVNSDGIVNESDANKLYKEMQEYHLGDLDMNGSYVINGDNILAPQITDATKILLYYAKTGSGENVDMSQIQLNLADTDLDGQITLHDSLNVLTCCARLGAELPMFENEQYYFAETE